MMTSFRKPAQAKGFTLIELMVSMGITAAIITIIVSITSLATDTWTRSRSQLRASRQAKVLIDTMAKDLESLVSRRGGNNEWLVGFVDSDSDLPAVVKSGGSNSEVAALTFLTAATDRYNGQVGESFPDNKGDVSCVSYRMRFKDPIEGTTGNDDTSTFVVYRMLVNPDETFEDLLGQEDLELAFSSGYESEVDDEENFVCENVHEVTITFLVEVVEAGIGDGSDTRKIARLTFDTTQSSAEFRLGGLGITTNLEAGDTTVDEDMIEAGRLVGVELSVSVLSDAGMIRRNAAGGLNNRDYTRQSFHYSRLVQVPGG